MADIEQQTFGTTADASADVASAVHSPGMAPEKGLAEGAPEELLSAQVSAAEDASNEEAAKGLMAHVVRSSFVAFADEIMSLYGSEKHDDRLDTLSSTSPEELKEERDKVDYRILWLEALLNESRLELELINSVIDSLNSQPDL